MIFIRHIFVPFLLALGLLMQLSLPLLQMKAAQAGFHAAPYICNLNGRAPTSDAQEHIQALLKLVDKDISNDEMPPSEHCSACVMPHLAVVTSDISQLLSTFVFSRKASFSRLSPGIYYFAQGPPLGSRAPPAFN